MRHYIRHVVAGIPDADVPMTAANGRFNCLSVNQTLNMMLISTVLV